MELTKVEAQNLLAFLERGAHPHLGGVRSESELVLYHELRTALLAVLKRAEALQEMTDAPQP